MDCGSLLPLFGKASLLAGKDGICLGKLSIYHGVMQRRPERQQR